MLSIENAPSVGLPGYLFCRNVRNAPVENGEAYRYLIQLFFGLMPEVVTNYELRSLLRASSTGSDVSTRHVTHYFPLGSVSRKTNFEYRPFRT
jgi:hypothetical protein